MIILYICNKCGSSNVGKMAWINPNTEGVLDMDPGIYTEWCLEENKETNISEQYSGRADSIQDDWNSNFRNWEEGEYTEEQLETLFMLLKERHPGVLEEEIEKFIGYNTTKK